MKILFMTFFIFYSFLSKADFSFCENSPVNLSKKEDWEKFRIEKWHNCFGELAQNYKNKKKWVSLFKNGLPNGYGVVKYENWDGYYEGPILNGKMHGEGKYINNNGSKLYLKCLHNRCDRSKKNIFQKEKENLDNFPKIVFENKDVKPLVNYNKDSSKLAKTYNNKIEFDDASNNIKVNNIIPNSEFMKINKIIINSQIRSLVIKNPVPTTDKFFKYIK